MTPVPTVSVTTRPELESLAPMLGVRNVSVSRRFYVDHLGFEITGEYAPEDTLCWSSLQSGGVELMLSLDPKCDSTAKSAQLYIKVSDADQLHATLKAKGLQVSDLANRFYEMREFEVRDPDGYLLILGQNIAGLGLDCSCGHEGCST